MFYCHVSFRGVVTYSVRARVTLGSIASNWAVLGCKSGGINLSWEIDLISTIVYSPLDLEVHAGSPNGSSFRCCVSLNKTQIVGFFG